MKDDRLYLIHITECIARIEEYTAQGKDAFFADRKTQDAVEHDLPELKPKIEALLVSLEVASS